MVRVLLGIMILLVYLGHADTVKTPDVRMSCQEKCSSSNTNMKSQ
jgi:hypothetical protein